MEALESKNLESKVFSVGIPEPIPSTEETKEFANKNSAPAEKKYNNNKNLPNGRQLIEIINKNFKSLNPYEYNI